MLYHKLYHKLYTRLRLVFVYLIQHGRSHIYIYIYIVYNNNNIYRTFFNWERTNVRNVLIKTFFGLARSLSLRSLYTKLFSSRAESVSMFLVLLPWVTSSCSTCIVFHSNYIYLQGFPVVKCTRNPVEI